MSGQEGQGPQREEVPTPELRVSMTAYEQLYFTTVRIEAVSPVGRSTGTGFVYLARTDRGPVPIVVTNRHVIDQADDLVVHFLCGDQDSGEWQRGRQAHWTVRSASAGFWFGHPNENIDVAAFPAGEILNSMKDSGHHPFFKAVTAEMLMTDEETAQLDALQPITFVGYPAGLFDTSHGTPIARRGHTATPLDLDYSGMPAFLIDAKVFPGSSGSPVFIGGDGISRQRNTIAIGEPRMGLLGILAAVAAQNVPLEVQPIADQPRRGVQLTQFLDLGIVFRSHAISEVIKLTLGQHGLSESDAA